MGQTIPEPAMVKYQFEIEDETWEQWKETVPRSKSLEQRIIELIEADRDGRVEDTAAEVKVNTTDTAAETASRETQLNFDWDEIGFAEQPDRVDALEAVYEYLREHGEARTPELVNVAEQHGVSIATPQRLISDAMKQLDDVQTPTPGSNVYKYIG